MAQAIPYLAFNGNCAEAMRFYEHVLGLGAKLEMMMNGADSPAAAQIPKEHAQRILHARLRFDDGSCIYAGDAPVHMPYEGIKGVTLTMSYASTEEGEAVFKSLAGGGNVIMPFQPVFWAKGSGMLTDKFGVSWNINGEVTM
jgi:PhnB protein